MRQFFSDYQVLYKSFEINFVCFYGLRENDNRLFIELDFS